MRHIRVQGPDEFFTVVAHTAKSQAATMVLTPGQSTGGADNRHPDADQWLFVISGSGRAVVNGREERLAPGSLLLIEAGETHEIAGSGTEPLVTINIYAPPIY